MAVTVDAIGPAGGAGFNWATVNTTGWAHINSAAGNAIVVGITWFSLGTSDVTAVTYGGVALARLGQRASNDATAGGTDYWGKVGGLPTGSNLVAVTNSRAESHNGGSVSGAGAGSLSAATTNAGSTGSIVSTAIVTTTGGLLIAACCNGAAGTWAVTGGTVAYSRNTTNNSASDNTCCGYVTSTGASQTITITNTTADFNSIVAVEILPVTSTAKSDTDVSAASAEGVPASVGVSDVPRWVG